MLCSYFKSNNNDFTLLQGDCIELMNQFNFEFDMIFANPPYFLSNNGISVQSGKVVSVNKGKWDKSHGLTQDNNFNYNWLKACRDKLKASGTIWISGTYHNIFSVAQMLTELDYKILNCITWAKTNPPPNISCKYFTHSTEYILWARKSKNVSHYFNYKLMKQINGGKQMRDIWFMPAISPWEKSCGKHPTQKPINLLCRIILASSKENEFILDPFCGSGTTGIATNLLNRRFLGIEKETEFLEMSKQRRLELEDTTITKLYLSKIEKANNLLHK